MTCKLLDVKCLQEKQMCIMLYFELFLCQLSPYSLGEKKITPLPSVDYSIFYKS
jgi:hypothetical protein